MKRILALIAASAALLALTTSCLLSMLLDDEPSGSSNYVDLGLSVKWATCNLGASSPEASGNYKGILNAGRDQGLSIRPVCD